VPDRCASGSKIAAGLSVIRGDTNPNVGGIVSDCCAIRMLAVLQRSVLMDDECAVRIAAHFGDETRVSSRKFLTVPSTTPKKIRRGAPPRVAQPSTRRSRIRPRTAPHTEERHLSPATPRLLPTSRRLPESPAGNNQNCLPIDRSLGRSEPSRHTVRDGDSAYSEAFGVRLSVGAARPWVQGIDRSWLGLWQNGQAESAPGTCKPGLTQ